MKTWPALILRFTPSTSTEMPVVHELVAAALDDLRPTAVQESDGEWRVFFPTVADRDLAATALPIVAPGSLAVEAIDVPDEDWARRSQQDLAPVHVGRITIAPPWQGQATMATGGSVSGLPASGSRPAAITILIQPSMGFGTGHHASTRLCTALLQRLDLSGRRVLDVGTGSGVLALVALALGAAEVTAVDDDADAIEAARENLELNGITAGIDLQVGDFRAVTTRAADVVTANLTGGLLIRAAARLTAAVAPGGALIISGVMQEEEAAVLAAFAPALTVAERSSEDEWIGALLKRA